MPKMKNTRRFQETFRVTGSAMSEVQARRNAPYSYQDDLPSRKRNLRKAGTIKSWICAPSKRLFVLA